MLTWDDLSFFNSFTSDQGFNAVVDKLEQQVSEGVSVLPSPENILNAYRYASPDQVKVVILGQDPYPDKTQAHGLAFSVPEGVHPFPKSLNNIFRELQDDLGCPEPSSGCLIPWAKQGVMLLNTSLTVVEGQRDSHSKIGWIALVNETIQVLNGVRENLVFILWGKKAQAKSMYIDENTHLVIRGVHPSPMSANRGGFFGTKPFSQANRYLEEHNIEPIDWCLK